MTMSICISINTVEVDPHSDSLHDGVVKPKNTQILTFAPFCAMLNCSYGNQTRRLSKLVNYSYKRCH